MSRDTFNPGGSAFFQTAGTLHGEGIYKGRDVLIRENAELTKENARLRAALAAVVTGCRAGGRAKQAALEEARRILG